MTATATTVEVKERPIIFSGPMVKAILEGRKTQTRRVVKIPHGYNPRHYLGIVAGLHVWEGVDKWGGQLECPYGDAGDRLWVREAFAHLSDLKTKDPGTAALMSRAFFRADHPTGLSHDDATDLKWRSPLFLPRDRSRITLEITNVRVERLREISEADAIAEGARFHSSSRVWSFGESGLCYPFAREAFSNGWNSLNAKRGYSWESNPFVWILSFTKL